MDMFRDLDAIPVLAREGAIVPLYRHGETNDLSNAQPLEIHIWRGSGSFTLFEDDGETKCEKHALTPMTVSDEGGSLRFVLGPTEGNPEILPRQREFTLIFRDVAAASATVNGEAVPYDPRGIPVSVSPDREVVVELSQVEATVNPPMQQLRTDLLTRVQGEILWKNTVFRDEMKMPKVLREALNELNSLQY